MIEVLVGSDPELFAFNPLTNKFVSGHDLIPGTKSDPFKVSGGAIQVDGVACEFNTNPAETVEEFVENHKLVIETLKSYLDPRDLILKASPTATFDQDYFDSIPEFAKLLGCTPDFNAYTGKENDPPSTKEPFRTGGGHLHFGWDMFLDPNDPEHFNLCRDVVKQLDTVLYPASLQWDADQKRRDLYGKLGAFRPKHYGVEYRPLSNAWLNDERTIRWVFEAGRNAVELLLNSNVRLWEEKPASYEAWGIPKLEIENG